MSAVRQYCVLSLCVLSAGGHITVCRCVTGRLLCLLYNTVCVMQMYPDSVLSGRVTSLSPPATETQRAVLTDHLQSWLLPSSEIKSLFSQAAYWISPSKHRCSASRTDNMGLWTTSGCLLILLKASELVLIWFTKGGQLGNRFCIELLWISSLWTNATSLCKLTPEESEAADVI